jgi:hypothetical protein
MSPARVATIRRVLNKRVDALEKELSKVVHAESRFTVKSAADLGEPEPLPANFVHDAASFAGKLTAREWRIKGIQPLSAEVCLVYGDSGSGKSFLINDMFAAVHLGREWNGKRTTQGRVIYLCAEGAGDHKYRLHAQASHYGVALSDLPPVIDNAPDLSKGNAWAAVIEQIIAAGGCDVLVIDTLAATNTIDENSSEMGEYLRNVKKIQRALRCTCWIVHHCGKDQSKGARGWSGTRAAVDVELEVSRTGDARSARVTKSKGDADGWEFSFSLKFVPLGKDIDGDVFGSCVVEYSDAPPVTAKKPPKRGTQPAVAFTAVQKLIRENKGAAIDIDDAREAIKATMPPPGPDDKDQRGSRAGALLEKLLNGEHLFRDGRMIRDSAAQTITEDWV